MGVLHLNRFLDNKAFQACHVLSATVARGRRAWNMFSGKRYFSFSSSSVSDRYDLTVKYVSYLVLLVHRQISPIHFRLHLFTNFPSSGSPQVFRGRFQESRYLWHTLIGSNVLGLLLSYIHDRPTHLIRLFLTTPLYLWHQIQLFELIVISNLKNHFHYYCNRTSYLPTITHRRNTFRL